MTTPNKYPAKVLLLGEHTILRGSRALAMPLWTHYSSWEWGRPGEATDLLALADYLDRDLPAQFATDRFRADLRAGLFLSSSIPVGYGLGSSGAVCVAVFARYATPAGHQQLDVLGPKAFFATMESYFHGASSGTDPLICYLEQSVQLFPTGTYAPVTLPPLVAGWQFFLLDTGQTRQTGPLVDYFLQRYDAEADFRAAVQAAWLQPSDAAIDALLAGDRALLAVNFRKISQFQLAALPPMVIPQVRPAWAAGLATGNYLLKICGAGGGGYCLGLTDNWARTKTQLADWKLVPLAV